MRYSIIDIGSNTIRMVIYEITGRSYREILNERDFSGIISYIKDDNLQRDGIDKLKSVLTKMVMLCKLLECNRIHCFATASLRNVQNAVLVIAELEKHLGIEIELLAGADEAMYDFKGLKAAIDESDGVGLDLGGGSCQLFHFENNEMLRCQSFPIGCLKVYEKFVSGIIPTHDEENAIRAYTMECLKNESGMKNLGYGCIYSMGGTARSAAKLHKAFTGSNARTDGYVLSTKQLDDLCTIVRDVSLSGVKMLAKVLPERTNTIVPGMIVLKTICDYVGADGIRIVKSGVREGYLHGCILKK